jgi:sugar/nucleoside kinase (ribokinase family)
MILVFGTVCLDRIRRVPTLPRLGGYIEVTDEQVLLGGEAANTALALKTWGAEVALYGNSLGSGEAAVKLKELLDQKGLPPSPEALGAGETPVCDVYVTPDGERTMFGVGFSTMQPTTPLDQMEFAGSWFTAEPNMRVAAREAAKRAHAAGMKLYLMDFVEPDDPVFADGFWQSSTDWVGFRGNTQKNVAWVREFVARHGCFTILSDGPNGLVAGSPNMPTRAYPPYPCACVVDSTGAGDMLRAGVLFGLDQGWAVSRCLQFGSAAGCLKCGSFGGTTCIPSRQEIERHIAENPEVSGHYL